MAFGGYKFKGYKVVRANLATNTYANWCLLVHQARIKAFMGSCALSGAQWHFSKTNGPLAFEDYGNVIYRVANANGEYHDYLSFFKYGDEELYYMIATLGEYYTDSGTSLVFNSSSLFGSYSSNAQVKYGGICSCLALDADFKELGPFAVMPAKSLACSSISNGATVSSSKAYSNESNANGNGLSNGTIWIGFATKGKDIVNLYQKNCTSVESGDTFSGYSTPNDQYGISKIILEIFKSSGEQAATVEGSRYYLTANTCECLADAGYSNFFKSSTVQSGYGAWLCIDIPTQSFYKNGNTVIPFSAPTLTTCGRNGRDISAVGMLTKGVIKGELLSVNYTKSQSYQPIVGTTVMGGNLITAIRCTPKTSSPYEGYLIPGAQYSESISSSNAACPAAYVGWDPSNPNINDDASWPELALQ